MRTALYSRVSTDKQELEQQIATLKRFCEYKQFKDIAEFSEIGSGKTFKRPALQEMLKRMRTGEFQNIVVFRFDRIGRNSREVIMLVDELESRGVQLFSTSEGLDTSTLVGKAMRDVLIILAQLERDNIAEATQQRLTALKNLGKKLGRPEKGFDVQKALELRKAGYSWAKLAMSLGIKASTVRYRLNELARKGGVEKPSLPT